MSYRLNLKFAILLACICATSLVSAQDFVQVEKPNRHESSDARQVYLKEHEDFTKRIKLTAIQKEKYEALIEKRNAALVESKSAGSKAKQTKQQIMDSYWQDFHAMLTDEQLLLLKKEQGKASVQ